MGRLETLENGLPMHRYFRLLVTIGGVDVIANHLIDDLFATRFVRQTTAVFGRDDFRQPLVPGDGFDLAFFPVSYTHLDVYKRQYVSCTPN